MWQSIVYQPQHLLKVMVNSKAWQKPQPLPNGERVQVNLEIPGDHSITESSSSLDEFVKIQLPDES
jgi:hypothetical protein